MIQVYNISDKRVIVKKSEKIAQIVFVKINRADFIPIQKSQISDQNRGGFGSTDTK